MYDDIRRYDDHYMPHSSQFGYSGAYGPYAKAGMYGQPQHAFSYDQTSPANAAAFSQGIPSRDSVYGRTGSAQPTENQQTGSSISFGSGMTDVFGRTPGSFTQNQPISQQQPTSAEEAAKGFDHTPKPGGPSPSLTQANRPGSAANVSGNPQIQTGLPPFQTHGQAFGVYPHLTPQYAGGLGSLSGHQAAASQAHHGTGYGTYGAAGFGGYYGTPGRGGWGGNYGH